MLKASDGTANVYTSYTKRGSVRDVTSSWGALVGALVHDADGLPQSITYGDVAGTRTDYGYDDRLRLFTVQTYRGPPALWASPNYAPPADPTRPTTFQLNLEDLEYSYDEVDNPTEIHDWRDPSAWPVGAKPVSRKIAYDDLYRVNRVDYEYAGGTDPWTDPYAPETNGTATDTHLAKPSPHVKFDSRVLYESFNYDWLGNTTATDDDAKGFYDRSLGAVTNGAGQSQPYQLKTASNESASGGGLRTGHLSTQYDKAGNLTDLAVVRKGPCLSVDGGSCTQRFHYDWDEAGRLVRARRWDVGGAPTATDPLPTTTAAADLTYAYDAGDMRVRKAATDAAGVTAYTLYPSAALEERRCSWSESAQDYTNDASHEVPQLIAHGVRLGRVSYESAAPGVPAAGSELPPGQHVFLSLSDHLGSTSTVIDLATSEVVEKRTSRAYGGVESDQRDARWGGAKDEKAFTGKEEDEEVGLTYFGARYLSSQLGRWVSADPLAVHLLGSDLNAYAYVSGDALRRVDPVGLDVAAPAPGEFKRPSPPPPGTPEFALDQGRRVGKAYGEAFGELQGLKDLVSSASGGADVWKRLEKTGAAAQILDKFQEKLDALPELPSFKDPKLADAARKGFALGFEGGYDGALGRAAALRAAVDVVLAAGPGIADGLASRLGKLADSFDGLASELRARATPPPKPEAPAAPETTNGPKLARDGASQDSCRPTSVKPPSRLARDSA